MAYVVLFLKDQEVGRRKLDGPVVIGRSPESDFSIRDILLSRRHCKIEAEDGQWVVTDLGSKNGTRIAGQPILRQSLRDGDVIRLGNSTVRFYAGKFQPATNGKPRPGTLQRPADPMEALQNTVTAFELEPRGEARNTERLPVPKPSPKEPDSYVHEDVRAMVKDLVSSSWDSIYEHASRPDPVMPRGQNAQSVRRRPREPGVDLALQLRSEQPDPSVATATASPPERRSLDLQPPVPRRRLTGGRIRALLRRLAMIFQWTALLMLTWH
jgi:predicted component of type VI protein secretion system